MPSAIDALLASTVQAVDLVNGRAASGKGFALDDQSFHSGYDALYALWKQAGEAREQIRTRSLAVQPSQVSHQIPGISDGAADVQDALYLESNSLDGALATVQTRIAKLLNAMHDGYVAYQDTDQESAFDLVKATSTS